MEPLVRVEDLRVSYDSAERSDAIAFEAIRGISLDLMPGHVVAVVGPNGAGKTTLFKALLGELPKLAGRVSVCGLDPFLPKDRRRLWSVARSITDTPALYEHLTAREFLEFSARANGVPEKLVSVLTYDVATNLGLAAIFDRRINEMSFGNQRKVHIAAGFFSGASGPRVLVMDEPTTGMDPPSRLLLATVLREYVNPNALASERCVLVSSHNLAELSAMADQVIMLNEGRIVASGGVRDLAAKATSDLIYELTLFDDNADALVLALNRQFDVECQALGRRAILLQCLDADVVQQVVRFLARPDTPFKLRELKERLTSLERVFIEGMETTGPETIAC